MRELDECRAEVFRRSENRIMKRRKTRKRVITCCAPLLLFVTIWSATSLPGRLNDGDTAKTSASKEHYENGGGDVHLSGDDEREPMSGGDIVMGNENEENKRPEDYLEVIGDVDESEFGTIDSFSFKLICNVKYKHSSGKRHVSYDSETGEYTEIEEYEDNSGKHKDEYNATYHLSEKEKIWNYEQIYDLDVMSFPDEYIVDDNETDDLKNGPDYTFTLLVKTDKIEKTINFRVSRPYAEDWDEELFIASVEMFRFIQKAVDWQEYGYYDNRW